MSANILALDIETIPDEDHLGSLVLRGPEEPFEAPAGYKDEDKKVAYIAKKRKAWEDGLVRKCSFDPAYGRTACVSLWDGTRGGAVSLREYGGPECPDAEAKMLTDVWVFLADADGLVTFNGIGFDLRWIQIRSAILRVPPSRDFQTARYHPWPCCDLMQILAGWEREKWKGLAEWCRIFGIRCEGKESGMDGSQVWQYVQDGRWDEVEAYCLSDARATWDLFLACSKGGLVSSFRGR